MKKDFDQWNQFKKLLHKENKSIFAWPREIWWCALGLNLGAETDGKNNRFERPVIIMRVYNKETMLVLPITTKERPDTFHYKILIKMSSDERGYLEIQKTGWVKLTQARVISNKRLLRKIDTASGQEFNLIRQAFIKNGV